MSPDSSGPSAGAESSPTPGGDSGIFRPGLLQGQVALITGGGSGIGLGIAELMGGLGARVVLASRSEERLRSAVQRLEASGVAASAVAVDVRDAERVREMVERVHAEQGRLDVLVNNAAGNFYAPSETLSANGFRSVLEIDLFGTFYCSQAVLPIMRAQGGGRIVNISMTLHYRGWPQMVHATAAKAGVDALTRTLALEWAPFGVRVNAIAPGPIPTEGVKRAFTAPNASAADIFAAEQGMLERVRSTIPAGRWGSPRDIANMVAFLASPAGEWITGAVMVVDGGEWLARGR